MATARICLFTVWLTAPVCLPGQATAISPYAAISGIVLNDATGTALRHVVITLSTLDNPPLEAVTFSESNGAFGFTNVPPGKYHLRAEFDGFEYARFGASTRLRPAGVLKLAPGDVRYGITLRLRPYGSISGVVLDPDGDPVTNTQLRLLRPAWERLKPTYQNAGWATTDDQGRYRFLDVVPGRYIVMASEFYQPALQMQPEGGPASATRSTYGGQFYPDATRISSATLMQLGAAQNLENIDFRLSPRSVAPLHGKLVFPDEIPANFGARIDLIPQDFPDQNAIGSFANGPDRQFEVPNAPAGTYLISADVSIEGHAYRAVERIELTPGGQEITLHMERGIDLAGRLDFEGPGERPDKPFRVTLISGDTPRVGAQPSAEVQPDGSFVIKDVVPGIWDISPEPIPPGGFIKSMRLGDQDVLTEDMLIGRGTRDPLRIVVSSRGAVLTGTVTVPEGAQKSARARVLLAPSGKFANVLSFYAEGAAGDDGHFEFKGITPGRYKLYAFEEMEPYAFGDPAFLKPYEPYSEEFEIREGAQLTRQVALIPAGTRPAGEN